MFCSSVGLKNVLKGKVGCLVNSQLFGANSSPWEITSESWLLPIPTGSQQLLSCFLLGIYKKRFHVVDVVVLKVAYFLSILFFLQNPSQVTPAPWARLMLFCSPLASFCLGWSSGGLGRP